MSASTVPAAGSDRPSREPRTRDATGSAAKRFGPVVAVVMVGAILTTAVSWATASLNDRNDRHSLQLQSEQVGEVLSAALPDTSVPLATSLEVTQATGGSPTQFSSSIASAVGANQQFLTATLWRDANGSLTEIAHVGAAPAATTAQIIESLNGALVHGSLDVRGLFANSERRIAFADALPGHQAVRYVVYAERAVPSSDHTVIARNSAFSELNFAIFLGRDTSSSDLLTSSFPRLPVLGLSDKIAIAYGDSALTVVVAPSGQLNGALGAQLPWIFGVFGGLLALLGAWATWGLVRRREVAEHDTQEIRRLYGELGQLYGQQRGIAETLQRALLPIRTPDIAGLEIGVRYIAGARGVNVGGDWYSVVRVDEAHFAFVVGDVSGRGISAATVMASVRHAVRAYAFEGHSPGQILRLCQRHLRSLDDGHFATVLVGVGDLVRNEITIANAGHLAPLRIDESGAHFLETKLGVPIGVRESTYEEVTYPVRAGVTLVAFTDGLVERRGESIDDGLSRLANAATGIELPVNELLAKLVDELVDDETEDDIALLAIRWVGDAPR